MAAWEMLKRPKYLVARASIERDVLKGERVEIYPATAPRKCLGFSAGKQLTAQSLAPQVWTDPKCQDVEPAPVEFTVDATRE